jgi:hypothetical protein
MNHRKRRRKWKLPEVGRIANLPGVIAFRSAKAAK